MRWIVAGILLVGLSGQGFCQGHTAAGAASHNSGASSHKDSIKEHVRVQSFELRRREDNYGIASFDIANETDKALNSIELFCWLNGDRARGTKVLVWPSPGPVPAHKQQRFANVNIGLVGPNPRGQCEVAGVD